MGQPKKVQAAKADTNYDWGAFGSANANGVNMSDTANDTVQDTQGGINQYVNELINPSYDSTSFKARQDILDANNRQYANQAGANAIERGARGSATQNILNSLAANRNNDMRTAMTAEDSRISNILSQLGGVENNYFNQSNTMANNILQRVLGNQSAQNAANTANTNAYNQWMNSLMSAGGSLAGAAVGAV